MEKFDLVIIGSGPGGYVCALRAAQLGLKTALVERYTTLGGTCLNVGCIPSKALLDSSERYHQITHQADVHGIEVSGITLNWSKMLERTKKVVAQTCQGVAFLMKKNKVQVFQGMGSFKNQDAHTVTVTKENQSTEEIWGKNVVIATGSKPLSLPGIVMDKEKIISSTEALNLKKVPKKMVVIGGGVIGLELGSVYARLGAVVEVIEFAPRLIPTMDATLAKELQKTLSKEGLKFYLQHGVSSVEKVDEGVQVTAKNSQGQVVTFLADLCLMAVGRIPYTVGLGLDQIGVVLDEKKRIPVDHQLQTKVSGVYAIGDVIQGPMLAHKAEEEGIFVAETLAGQKPHINYKLIPGVVYTWPEVASVGATEEELLKAGIPFKKGEFPFKASGRARASEESDGLIKVLAHQLSDEILGVHMIGPRVADMIAQAVTAMEFRAAAEDIARICHPHPTYSEAFKEACMAATENRALHI